MPKLMLSYFCLLVGTIGLILPVIPGIPLLIAGFHLLGPDHWLSQRAASFIKSLRARQ